MSNLPTLAELTAEPIEAYKKDQFTALVNQPPPGKWVKEHPYIKGHHYLPIDKIEYLLKRIFRDYRVEILDTKMMMNAVVCQARVHYLHPVTNEWTYHDGVGAEELQTVKDSGALKADMSNVQRGALPMAVPIAEVSAIKDACHKIGDIFGASLNRKDLQPYTTDPNLKALSIDKPILEGDSLEEAKVSINEERITMERLSELWHITDEALEYLEEEDA